MILFSLLFSTVCIITFSGQLIITLQNRALRKLRKINIVFYFSTLLCGQIAGAAVILSGTVSAAELSYRIYAISVNSFSFAFLPLAFSITDQKNSLQITVFALVSFLIYTLANILINPFDGFYPGNSGFYVPEISSRSIYLNIIPVLFLISGLISVAVLACKTASETVKQRLYYFSLATVIIFSGLLTNLTPLKDYPADVVLTMTGGMLLAYALLRKRLLNIRKNFFRGALLSILTAGATGVFTLLLYITSVAANSRVSYLSVIPSTICFIIIFLVFTTKQKAVSRLILASETVYKNSAVSFDKKLQEARDINSIFLFMNEWISREFPISRYSVFMIENNQAELAGIINFPEDGTVRSRLPLDEMMLPMPLLKKEEILIVEDHLNSDKGSAVLGVFQSIYSGSPPDIILPIKIHGEVIGVILLKFSADGRFIDSEDIAYLLELKRITSDAVTRTIAFNQLEQEVYKKDNLIRDINHRVKNNLQMIAGLLTLQSLSSGREDVREALDTATQRIGTISKVHEMLYIQGVVETVNLKDYIENVISNLKALQSTAADIEYDVNLPDQLSVETEKALTICLIINELLTNAVKYAFPDNQGIITISAETTDNKCLLFIISDNGKGYDTDSLKTEGIGHSLVEKFITKQLKGSWEIDGTKGTTHRLYIPL